MLHGRKTKVWGDIAYQGRKQAIKATAPQAQAQAQDLTHRRGSRGRPQTDIDIAKYRNNQKIRAKGEHPFPTIKRIYNSFDPSIENQHVN